MAVEKQGLGPSEHPFDSFQAIKLVFDSSIMAGGLYDCLKSACTSVEDLLLARLTNGEVPLEAAESNRCGTSPFLHGAKTQESPTFLYFH